MISICELSNKLNMLYNNCTILSDKSCICQDTSGIYRLYNLNSNGYEECSRYVEFVKLTKLYNKFRKVNSRLYGVCDNTGKAMTQTLYEDIGAVKNSSVVVKEIGTDYGLLELETFRNTLDCKYSEIRLYNNSEYLVATMKYYGIVELYNYSGNKVIDSRFSEIILTDKIILCSIDLSDAGAFEIYDYELNLLANNQSIIKVYTERGFINVRARIDNVDKYWKDLWLQDKIKAKVGLSI